MAFMCGQTKYQNIRDVCQLGEIKICLFIWTHISRGKIIQQPRPIESCIRPILLFEMKQTIPLCLNP